MGCCRSDSAIRVVRIAEFSNHIISKRLKAVQSISEHFVSFDNWFRWTEQAFICSNTVIRELSPNMRLLADWKVSNRRTRCTHQRSTPLLFIALLYCIALHSSVIQSLYCFTLLCIALHCIWLSQIFACPSSGLRIRNDKVCLEWSLGTCSAHTWVWWMACKGPERT